MRLCREIDDGIGFTRQPIDQATVADIALDKAQPLVIARLPKVLFAAGVSQLVEDAQANLGVGTESLANESRPNKTGSSGHEQMAKPEPGH